MRWAAILFVSLWVPAGAGVARADDVAAALRRRDWAAAAAMAGDAADSVMPTLVSYLRVLTPGAAGAADIGRFMSDHPDWPQQGLLARRYADALVAERDDRVANDLCRERTPVNAAGLLRCADAASGVGSGGPADARRAWQVGITDPAGEAAFMRRWGGSLVAGDQWERFEWLAWTQSAAPGGVLARQAVRLEAMARPAAEARMALRRDDPAGADLFAALPGAARADPGLVLDLLRWYRRANRDSDAVRVWGEIGTLAEQAAPEGRQALFWNERDVLARRLNRGHLDALAYAVASLPTAAATARGDAAFLCGWLALRRLQQPELAAGLFRSLAEGSASAITNGRAFYWLGRALATSGQSAAAEAAYRQAAGWATSYYGQLASLALGEGVAGLRQRITVLTDPAWPEAQALAFAGSDLGRAATLLMAWGEVRQARPFLQTLEARATNPAERSMQARFAAELGLQDQAVAAARLAGRDGTMLPVVGWPEAADPPAGRVERAVALGVIRQESSFDPLARSPAGAMGLMQLMPATAAQVGKSIGKSIGRSIGEARPDLGDPATNLRLGTMYLGSLLDRFGAIPPALAGYNAGPNRVREWIGANGDPGLAGMDPIDWVELIPFGETRNYVQRIVENIMIYRAHEGVDLPHPVLAWAGSGS